MNKIKSLVLNCKSKINSLLNRVKGKEITHILMTTSGDKIKCHESIEVFSNEAKFMLAKCQIGIKQYIITIDDNNINYILEKYDDKTWNRVLNIGNIDDEETIENGLYG